MSLKIIKTSKHVLSTVSKAIAAHEHHKNLIDNVAELI